LPANASVLDLGAGSGVMAKELMGQLRGGRLVLLDAQQRMLVRAKRRLISVNGVEPAFSVGLAEALPFRDSSFDLVLMVTVVGEVTDTALTMLEVRRVLRPGGVLSIAEQLPDLHFRSVGRVRALLRESGFEERDYHADRWSYTLNATRVGRP
jgi:ubiquinone/menaquinone biosynthesis C-methylase UbiE